MTAGDIQTGSDIDILNPDHVICTLDDGASKVHMELTVETGKGYVPADKNRPEDAPIGLIPVDAICSARSSVSATRSRTPAKARCTDYDKLTMTVETNGA